MICPFSAARSPGADKLQGLAVGTQVLHQHPPASGAPVSIQQGELRGRRAAERGWAEQANKCFCACVGGWKGMFGVRIGPSVRIAGRAVLDSGACWVARGLEQKRAAGRRASAPGYVGVWSRWGVGGSLPSPHAVPRPQLNVFVCVRGVGEGAATGTTSSPGSVWDLQSGPGTRAC